VQVVRTCPLGPRFLEDAMRRGILNPHFDDVPGPIRELLFSSRMLTRREVRFRAG
jgi:hypothetical protein